VFHTFPPREPGRHGIAELLELLDGIRAVAFDRTLADDEVARRVRDLLREHDGSTASDRGSIQPNPKGIRLCGRLVQRQARKH
jgi:hypothetical protein